MRIYHPIVCILIIYGLYITIFNRTEMPYSPNEIMLEMEQLFEDFEPLLGKSALRKRRTSSKDAYLEYEFMRQKGVTSEQIRAAFIKFGWKPIIYKSRDGNYEAYCMDLIEAVYGFVNDKIQVTFFYSKATSCFEGNYEKYKSTSNHESI